MRNQTRGLKQRKILGISIFMLMTVFLYSNAIHRRPVHFSVETEENGWDILETKNGVSIYFKYVLCGSSNRQMGYYVFKFENETSSARKIELKRGSRFIGSEVLGSGASVEHSCSHEMKLYACNPNQDPSVTPIEDIMVNIDVTQL